ncbi:hypothetical protein [Clostridium boliviensis]|uniref:hypothetical protein n=1 Tax=Clostridium boliviensis TaxID=318465 RepID=UPI002964DEC3|nr:hypothetical protein [Clostridium boliviensis]
MILIATAEEIIDKVGIPKEEYEQVSYYGQVIFWSAPIKTFSKTDGQRLWVSLHIIVSQSEMQIQQKGYYSFQEWT